MTRVALALIATLAFVAAARAADLPTGTWAANVDGDTGELVIKSVKDGKVTGVLLGTDFTGTWDGKELRFTSGKYTFDAQLVREPGDKGLTKFTLTGGRTTVRDVATRANIHIVKAGGWYAQLSAEEPKFGEIKAEVRGVLTVEGTTAYVAVRRKTDSGAEEVRVWVSATADEWKLLAPTLTPLSGKEVVVTAGLTQSKAKDATAPGVPSRGLYFVGKLDVKPVK
jgi:hypothetical protein